MTPATTMDISDRLVLGTVQLGLDYGISNNSGKPELSEAKKIVDEAFKSGVREFDTAQTYGDSEKVLGVVFQQLKISNKVKIITKPDPEINYHDEDALRLSIDKSLRALNIKKIFCCMLHREELLDLWEVGLGDGLLNMVSKGSIENIGISVYSPRKAILALQTKGLNIIQLPSNMLDRRFEKAGVFKLAKKMNKTIYIRSVFLQGLILSNPNKIPLRIKFAESVIKKIFRIASKYGMTQHELAIAYAKCAFPDSKIILGVESQEQIKMNINSWNKKVDINLKEIINKEFDGIDEKILNPGQWPILS